MKKICFRRILRLLCLTACLLSACGKAQTASTSEESGFSIYYLNKGLSALNPVSYTTGTKDQDSLIDELTGQIMKVPDNVDAVVPLEDKVTYLGRKLDAGILTLNFDDNYSSMSSSRIVLCNAAFTETLTQIPGVEHVNFFSGDQPLKNADGTPVGPLSASDFIDNITNVNAYEKKELNLYFSNADGTGLTEEKREVVYNMDTPLEQIVVEQIIKGPGTEGLKATVSPDTKVLSLSVSDGVCYINFNNAFLTAMPGINLNLTVYSLVNSLSELTTVKKVQIAVEGSQKVMLGDTISLDTLFERNLDYVRTAQ